MNVNIQLTWENSNEHKACILGGLHCTVTDTLSPHAIGIGSVEYCRSAHPWPACDPYPDWLPWGRKIYRGYTLEKPLFYKPADIPKRFTSAIMSIPPSGKWVASELVDFVTEWRAYIVDGNVLAIFCYSDFDNEYSLEFPWKIPAGVTAAIDFGLTSDGKILPVEVNDPYAIGWYGPLSQYKIYTEFIVAGWHNMIMRYGN